MVQEAMEQQPLIDIFDLFILVKFFLKFAPEIQYFCSIVLFKTTLISR